MNWFSEGDWTAIGFVAVCVIVFGPLVWKVL